MKAVVGLHFEYILQPIERLIDRLCLQLSVSAAANGSLNRQRSKSIDKERNKADEKGTEPQAPANVTLNNIERVLRRFITYVLRHLKVL